MTRKCSALQAGRLAWFRPHHLPSLPWKQHLGSMGTASDWAVRCVLVAAWSSSTSVGSEAFAFVSSPPGHGTKAATTGASSTRAATATAQRRCRVFSSLSSAGRAPPVRCSQHTPGRLHGSSDGREGISRVETASFARVLPPAAPRSSSHGHGSRSGSNRRRRDVSGPLFAEDQGWLDALKGVADEPGLPLGPSKKVGGCRYLHPR